MDEPSKRLVEQRLRNRMLETIEWVADYPDLLGQVGFGEYINLFFDWFPDDGEPYPNSTVTPAEHAAFAEVHQLMIKACDDTHGDMTNDEFIATGWPQRIQPVAARAAALMLARGRFSEDHVEAEPSGRHE